MIIFLLLVLQFLYLYKRIEKYKAVSLVLFSIALWNVGFLVIFQLELFGSGLSVMGSDESVYYTTMKLADSLSSFKDWYLFLYHNANFGYVLYGSLILNTSWIDSVFLIRLCNVMLFLNMLLVFSLFMRKYFKIQLVYVNIYLLLIGLNGVITWTAIRNLKDILFIYLLMIFIYVLFSLIKEKFTIPKLLLLFALGYFIQDIRQWFVYLVAVIIISVSFVELIKRKRYFWGFSLSLISGLAFFTFMQKGFTILGLYTNTYASSGLASDGLTQMVNGSLLSLPISMARFILGPGPIRAIFGSESFMFTTHTGNTLIALGSMIWWLFLPLFFMSMTSLKHIRANYLLYIITLFYWMLYAYSYAGTGDTRLRAVLYILCTLCTIPYITNRKWVDVRTVSYIGILFFIVIIGIYTSMGTLT